MSGAQAIATYQDILAVTEQMLQAARCGDWERLTALEKAREYLFERVIASGLQEPLGEASRQRKIDILRRILACDTEITNIVDPWTERLQRLLSSVGHEKRLRRAYQLD